MADPRVPVAVEDTETLHRVIDPDNIKDDKPHYMAFYSSTVPHRISVDRAAYRSAAESLEGESVECRVAALVALDVRGLAFTPRLKIESVPENGNDAHAEIVASEELSKKFMKTKVCAQLADISRLI